MTTPAELSDGRVVCASAPQSGISGATFVAAKLSLNGVEYGVPQFVRVYEQPRLFTELVPVTGGPISGGTLITLAAAAVFSYFKVSRVLEKNKKCAEIHASFKGCCTCGSKRDEKADPPLLAP